ncbi:MAG TPA: sulfatase [Bryobacteraceae bacterium]|jgi:arylsulfatase A-like enzyme|nr:sulfatase [Bryobacteraceae bacterium]
MQTDRRTFIGGLAATAAAAPSVLAQTKNRPNIVYMHSHDTGRYIQPYGYPVPAPNLQRLAEAGILFRQAFSAAPTCSPSRGALLTGQCCHSAGIYGLANRGFFLADYKQHIIHTLRKAGYFSAIAGVQHIAPIAENIGYDKVLRPPGFRLPANKLPSGADYLFAKDVTPLAVDFLNHAPRQPFWLTVGFGETHRKFHDPGPAEDSRHTAPPAPLPDAPETRRDFAAFQASVRVLDTAMGEVLRALEANGLAENTLVICTTDHGIPFPDMKCNLTDHGSGVYLMLRGPGPFSGHKALDSMVSQIDLFPTVCDYLDIERPAWIEGKSMMPLLRGETAEINDEIFAEVNYHAAYEPKRSVRTRQWKYVRHFDGRTRPVLVNCDDGPSKKVWLTRGWKDRHVDTEQLYDLTFDPCERNNLAGDASRMAVLADMRARLERWMRVTKDPLLHGTVPAPSGASYNSPDATSGGEPLTTAP